LARGHRQGCQLHPSWIMGTLAGAAITHNG
jgi:hypothetical protein